MFIDNFSGEITEIKKKDRTDKNILKVLNKYPLVSTWDMSEKWVWQKICYLIESKLIEEIKMSYPWHKYKLTDNGLKIINET